MWSQLAKMCGARLVSLDDAFSAGFMHELSIMQSALDLALDQARVANARRITAVCLRVGALSGVVAEALDVAFEALTPGTLAEGAELVIEPVTARFWCPACRHEFEPTDLCGQCPACGGLSSELRAGRELELASLEIDDV